MGALAAGDGCLGWAVLQVMGALVSGDGCHGWGALQVMGDVSTIKSATNGCIV